MTILNFFKTRLGIISIAVMSNTLLTLTKMVVGIMTGSISILSEAVHSGIDLLASIIAFFAIKKAAQPADETHAYGHGKVENLSALFESALIFIAAGAILFESSQKLLHPSAIEHGGLGIGVMLFSTIINLLVSYYLISSGKKMDSPALEADGHHLRTDVYTSIGVALGLILYELIHISWIDPLMAMMVAVLIVKMAFDLGREAIGQLTDMALPPEEEALIHETLQLHKHKIFDYHEVRSRKSGSERHVDLHLVLCKDLTIEEGHKLCDHLEEVLEKKLPNTKMMIHVEPCNTQDASHPCGLCHIHSST